ncbi:hypothetical protein [Kitasatospora sp. NPDC057015]|uniref:hypothetical protein n=1 Tax=Kitasatospora sp. NPDC057015 TaxID=3346001 RepID=UPI00362652C5
MSDYSVLVAALTQLHTDTDDGSGPPPRLAGHEADRLASTARRDDAPAPSRPAVRLLRRPFGRRPSFA